MFTVQDPFVKFMIPTVEDFEKQTKMVEAGGISPTWLKEHDNSFDFELQAKDVPDSTLKILLEIWNENAIMDDLIGSATIEIKKRDLSPGGTQLTF